MAQLFYSSKFHANHGTFSLLDSTYKTKISIVSSCFDNFIGNIDHDQIEILINGIISSIADKYLDDIVGRATNENIGSYILWKMYREFKHNTIIVEIIQNDKFGISLSSFDISLLNYETILHYKLGATHFVRCNYDTSENYFDNALIIDPNYLKAIIGKGRCLFKKRQFKKAITYFDIGKTKFPECGEIYRNLGNAYLERNNLSEAINNLKHSIKLIPTVGR